MPDFPHTVAFVDERCTPILPPELEGWYEVARTWHADFRALLNSQTGASKAALIELVIGATEVLGLQSQVILHLAECSTGLLDALEADIEEAKD